MIEANRVPLSNKLAIDREALANLVDQMRLSIPDQIQEADEILRERDAIIARAQDEARRTLEEAKAHINKERMREKAEQEAEIILQEARQRALAFEDDARLYVQQTLKDLAQQLETIQAIIRNGLDELKAPQEATDLEETVSSS